MSLQRYTSCFYFLTRVCLKFAWLLGIQQFGARRVLLADVFIPSPQHRVQFHKLFFRCTISQIIYWLKLIFWFTQIPHNLFFVFQILHVYNFSFKNTTVTVFDLSAEECLIRQHFDIQIAEIYIFCRLTSFARSKALKSSFRETGLLDLHACTFIWYQFRKWLK